ncbi:unnamed protein product [marine sediment metagenome]|uniref:Uncharacterized protein n=3 Tax=marine sediment metagenome TaxID=412755 RepID=X1PFG9_9ZZZZ
MEAAKRAYSVGPSAMLYLIGVIIGVVVILIVGTAVLPIIMDSVATAAACLTGAAATMLNLVPL